MEGVHSDGVFNGSWGEVLTVDDVLLLGGELGNVHDLLKSELSLLLGGAESVCESLLLVLDPLLLGGADVGPDVVDLGVVGIELLLHGVDGGGSLLLSIAVVSLDFDLDALGVGLLERRLSLVDSGELVLDVLDEGLLLEVPLLLGSLEFLLDLLEGDGGLYLALESLLDLGVD